jgi:hypothetical protein
MAGVYFVPILGKLSSRSLWAVGRRHDDAVGGGRGVRACKERRGKEKGKICKKKKE